MIPATQCSLSRRLSIAIIGVVAIIALIVAFMLIVYSTEKLETDLQQQVAGALRMATTSLPTPLWQFNYDFFADFLDALFSNQHFVYAAIIAHDEVVAIKVHPDFSQKEWAFFEESSSKFLTKRIDIVHEDQKIGAFHLAISTAGIRQELAARIVAILLFTLLLILAISLTTISITKRYIIHPLAHLVESATAIAQGELNTRIHLPPQTDKTRNEIGVLAAAFQHMLTYLHSMATLAMQISNGDLQQQITPKSERDVLGTTFQRMTTYLQQIGSVAEHISQGHLQTHFTPHSDQDQLGIAFTRMQQSLLSLIARIQTDADDIALISEQMLRISSSNSTALDHIGKAAETTTSAMLQMNMSAKDIRTKAEELRSALESIRQMASSIEQVAAHSVALSQSADETGKTMISIMHALKNIAEQAAHSQAFSETTAQDAVSGRHSVVQVITSIRSISEVTDHVSELIVRLHKHSLAIGAILDVINEVVEQTSLLSLNASIIAAQAGVHGKGFAVVANEIKELATRVKSSTTEIATIVQDVQRESSGVANAIQQAQHQVEDGVVLAHKAGEALQKIEQSAGSSSKLTAEIAASVQQQTTTSTDITRSMQGVVGMIHNMTRGIQYQKENADQLVEIAEHLQQVSLHVLDATQMQQQHSGAVVNSMETVLTLVLQNSEMVDLLSEAANQLAEKADGLKSQVNRFVLPA